MKLLYLMSDEYVTQLQIWFCKLVYHLKINQENTGVFYGMTSLKKTVRKSPLSSQAMKVKRIMNYKISWAALERSFDFFYGARINYMIMYWAIDLFCAC